MSRGPFELENGIISTDENSTDGVHYLQGAGDPGSTTATDNATVGSNYLNRTSGFSFQKDTAGAGADKWVRQANLDDILNLSWRSEVVRAATGDADPGASHDIDATPFTDDDSPLLVGTDFNVGEFIIYGIGGTPILKKITNIVADVLTLSTVGVDPLANNDTLQVRNYLPDAPDPQEKQAIVLYNGADIIKISDFNWELATGINISAGFTPASGDPNTNDTVESMLEKLDGNTDANDSNLGTSQGATNQGTFTGGLFTDNQSVKTLFQEAETELERLDGQLSANAVTAEVSLDELSADDFQGCLWLVKATLDSAPGQTEATLIWAIHNGHSGADATGADDTAFGKLKVGSASFNVGVDVNGAGGSQVFRLRVSASSAVSFRAKRISPIKANGI